MVRRLVAIAAAAAMMVAAGWPAQAAAKSSRLHAGVVHVRLDSAKAVVNAIVVEPQAPVQLVEVKARGRLETVSSMCKRVKCLAGINGDFFNRAGKLVTGTPASSALVPSQLPGEPLHRVAGRPVLGQETLDLAPLANSRHPRTLLGRTANGGIVMAVADGRQPAYSRGMTLPEAIAMMRRLGAVEVVNLDGGGSSTLVVEGKVRNRPSDVKVRRKGVIRNVRSLVRGDQVIRHLERRVANGYMLVPMSAAKPAPKKLAPVVKKPSKRVYSRGSDLAAKQQTSNSNDRENWLVLAFCMLVIYMRMALANQELIRQQLYERFGRIHM